MMRSPIFRQTCHTAATAGFAMSRLTMMVRTDEAKRNRTRYHWEANESIDSAREGAVKDAQPILKRQRPMWTDCGSTGTIGSK